MEKNISSGFFGTRNALLAGECASALALAYVSSPASAATYTVSNDTELRDAITTANADGDSSATIQLTADFAVSATNLPPPTKPITIDTQGFTSSNPRFANAAQLVTLVGTFGGPFNIANSAAFNNGTISGVAGMTASTLNNNSTLVNNNTINAGSGSASTASGIGVDIRAGSTLINNGIIKGWIAEQVGGLLFSWAR